MLFVGLFGRSPNPTSCTPAVRKSPSLMPLKGYKCDCQIDASFNKWFDAWIDLMQNPPAWFARSFTCAGVSSTFDSITTQIWTFNARILKMTLCWMIHIRYPHNMVRFIRMKLMKLATNVPTNGPSNCPKKARITLGFDRVCCKSQWLERVGP